MEILCTMEIQLFWLLSKTLFVYENYYCHMTAVPLALYGGYYIDTIFLVEHMLGITFCPMHSKNLLAI